MLFANWARGFRPGTFNAGLLTLPPAVVDFLRSQAAQINVEEETLDQFELGVKGEWLGGRVQGSLVTYAGKLENQQIPQSFFINQPGFVNTVSFTSNAGKTDIQGIELEWKALVTEKLLLNGHVSWNDTEIKSDACAACVRLGATLTSSIGKRLESVPEYTGSLVATYTTPFRGAYDWRLRGEYFYQGKEYAERLNLATGGEMHKVNFRAGVESEEVTIEAYLTNAFDENTPNSVWLGIDLPSGLPSVKVGFPERRQWGLRAAYSF